MTRPGLLNPQPFQWFASSYQEAMNDFNSDGGLVPIASQVHKNNNEDPDKNFPYQQIIRGNGACFLNASILGILNKCVNNNQRWETFKNNIYRIYGDGSVWQIIFVIDQNCKRQDGQGLDRDKLYELLKLKGDNNIVTQLVGHILIPQHQSLIAYYQARILDTDQKLEFEEATKGAYSGKELESSNLRIEVLGNARRLYNQYKQYIEKARWQFATSYEEAPLTQLVSLLTAGMGRGGEALTVLTICRDNIRIYGEIIDVDEDKIYLYNHDGRSHFNLWFSKNDQICQELEPQVRLLQETKTKEQAGQLEKFNQLKQEILEHIGTIDERCVNDIMGSSTLEDLEFNQENLLKLDLLKSIKKANSHK